MSDPLLKSNPNDPGVESKDINLLIATPAYGGVTHVPYNRALRKLEFKLFKYGIRHYIGETTSESLIPRARNGFANTVAFDKDAEGREFTHLLFIDADIYFNADNIVQMLGFNKDICALPYACKDINWHKVAEAVRKGVPEEHLHRMGSRPIINTNGTALSFDTTKPVQIPQLGTGCLLIKRHVLLKMAEEEDRRYNLMEGEKNYGARTWAYDFFRIGVNPETRFYDSEDYRFCLDARRLGFETWLLPWAVTAHVGSMSFMMDIQGQAQYGITSGPTLAPDTKSVQTILVPNPEGFTPATRPS